MYLHKADRVLFRDIIIAVSEMMGIEQSIVEKDYYVTMILKCLSDRNAGIVFKGGTSLSKAFHVIDRFSEDIDITFEEHIGAARRKKLKYNLMKSVGDELELPIENWDSIESDRDYNHYDYVYTPVIDIVTEGMPSYVKAETALMSYAFPTEEREIDSFIYRCLKESDPDIMEDFNLHPFIMKTQTLERTFADKLFAVCDYYMNGRPIRNSRHLYDVYKLMPFVEFDRNFAMLLKDVRKYRSEMDVRFAPSARGEVDLLLLVDEIRATDFYRKDYEESTRKLIRDDIGYDEVMDRYSEIMYRLF